MQDIQLIWDNCKTYNQPESGIYRMAEYMEKLTKKSAEKLKIFVAVKKREEVEKVLAGDLADQIPPEDPNA